MNKELQKDLINQVLDICYNQIYPDGSIDYNFLEEHLNNLSDEDMSFKITPGEDEYTLNVTLSIKPDIIIKDPDFVDWLINSGLDYSQGYDYDGSIIYAIYCSTIKEDKLIKNYCKENNLDYEDDVIINCQNDYTGNLVLVKFSERMEEEK